MSNFSFHRFIIYFHQPESRPKTLVPFKIVQQRPVKISLDVRAFGNGFMDPEQMVFDESRAPRIVRVRQTAFGYVNREIMFCRVQMNAIYWQTRLYIFPKRNGLIYTLQYAP